MDADDLAVLTSWAEAVAEAVLCTPDRLEAALADAQQDAPWRGKYGIREPSSQLSQAIASLAQLVRAITVEGGDPTIDALLDSFPHPMTSAESHARMATRVLASALKARQARVTEDRAVRGDILTYALA